MCLILFSYRPDSKHPLVIGANRDEVHERATQSAGFWEDEPSILAGKDLVAKGTWIGCDRSGRFAALTNFSGQGDPEEPLSRGGLVHNFLVGDLSSLDYAQSIRGDDYAGFNLLIWDRSDFVYTSNKAQTRVLDPGEYGLSNAELGAPWPKCVNGKENLARLTEQDFHEEDLIQLLADQYVASDEELPQRGRTLEMERKTAPCFIKDPHYGTRASTVIILTKEELRFVEQSYLANGVQSSRQSFRLDIG